MKKLTILGISIVALFSIQIAKGQNISTYAGNGVAGYTGDGGAATAAEITSPFFLRLDPSGNLLMPDLGSNCVRKITTSGIISTIAGNGVRGYSGDGGAATAGELNDPSCLAEDAMGNIYIADHFNNVVRKVNTSGIISTFAGNGIQGYSGNGGLATAAEMYTPIGVTVSTSGIVYITDAGNYVIRQVNTSGIISVIAGNTIASFSGDGGPATAAEINWPSDIIMDPSGNILFTDFYSSCIRKINTSGIITTIAGIGGVSGYSGNGGPATAAEMNWGNGIFLDGAGNLYSAEENNNCIRMINTSGIISTIAGNTIGGFSGDGGPATAAELLTPVGVAVNSSSVVFISDYANHRLRKVIQNTEGISTIEDMSNSVLVYPNPAKEVICIQMQNTVKAEKVMVYNITGQKMLENNSEGKQNMEISTSGLSNGVYFVTVVMTDGSSIIKKIEVIK